MLPIYIESTNTIIRSATTRYVHPITGEIYGRTDYDNSIKLAEIGAVSLREEMPNDGYIATEWEIIDDPENAGGKLRRPSSSIPIPSPSLDELKINRIAEAEAKTKEIYARGVPAQYRGNTYYFDTRTGERAAANWQILDSVILRGLMDPISESMLFPRNVPTINDGENLELSTAAEANDFYISLMTSDHNIAVAGAELRCQIRRATNIEELNAIVDERT